MRTLLSGADLRLLGRSIVALLAVVLVAACERGELGAQADEVTAEQLLSCVLEGNAFATGLIRKDIFTPETEDLDAAREDLRNALRRYTARSLRIVEDALETAREEGRDDLVIAFADYCEARDKRGDLAKFIEREMARAADDY